MTSNQVLKAKFQSRTFWLCIIIVLFDIYLATVTLILKNIDLDGWGGVLTVLNLSVPVYMFLSKIEKMKTIDIKKGDMSVSMGLEGRVSEKEAGK